MKLRMFALFAILAFAAWLPDAAQQSPASQAAEESQAPAATTSPEKDAAANPACVCCDHA
jgi:cyanate permease